MPDNEKNNYRGFTDLLLGDDKMSLRPGTDRQSHLVHQQDNVGAVNNNLDVKMQTLHCPKETEVNCD